MKKIIMYVMTLLIAVVIGGCTKEGPAGKDGIDGKDGRDGKDGKNGSIIITGNGVPNVELGNVGDYYFDRTTSDLYGAKTAQSWGTPTNLKGLQGEKGDKGDTGATGSTGANGTDGNKFLSGITAPTADLGKVGDWYIDTQNRKLYGAKTEQGWGSGISLSGGNSEGISASDYKLSADGKTLVLWMNLNTRNIDMNADPNLSQVTTIQQGAFENCNALNSIIISNSVKKIEKQTFEELIRLKSVVLGKGVEDISSDYAWRGGSNYYQGGGVFSICKSLKTITIPSNVKYMQRAFTSCLELESVIIENGVINIDEAFIQCKSLTSVVIPNSVTSLKGAFADCERLTSVTLPSTITEIGKVVKPYSSSFSQGTFENCKSLSTINIPNSVTHIGYSTFASSGLVSVVLPNSVTELERATFANCEKLTSVTLSNQMTIIKGVVEGYYNQNATFYNCKALTALTIPANITTIEKGAFFESGLTSVTLEATTPPQLIDYIGLFVDQYDENNYNSTPKLTKVKTIYVPASSLSAYQNAEGWKDLATNGISLLPKP
ncbi:leucine-rich repeat protein [Capnocytophaga canis]|uniref:leucine-rich repeat protein n=1 Tax=Capnocytophaga canis TaxID=1848903 RepID=UPI00370DAD82